MQRKPNYADFSSQLNDKNIVVLEFGRHLTRCGFAGESAPRAIIETALENSNGEQLYLHDITDQDELKKKLSEFIERIYFNYLAVSPKDKKVVIVESVFCKSIFRYVLTHIFFDQLNIPSIMFVPDHLMALATLGNSTGLILDMGEYEAISIAVVNGVTLLDKTQFSSLGAKTLDLLIYNELIKNNPNLKQYLKPKVVEDVRVKSCFVAPYERGMKMTCDKIRKSKKTQGEFVESKPKIPDPYVIADEDDDSPKTISYSLGGQKTIDIPGNLREGACEILFELRGHEHSLTTMILETILMAPIDCRRELSENILVIGGVANLPGLEHRLAQELAQIDQSDRPEKKIEFKFHKPICPRNYICWLGASMFCTPNSTELRSTTRDKWLKDQRRNIRDWSDLILADRNN